MFGTNSSLFPDDPVEEVLFFLPHHDVGIGLGVSIL